jgi:hypothetical protein
MAEGSLAFAVSPLVGVASASRLIMNVHCSLIAMPYEIGFCA